VNEPAEDPVGQASSKVVQYISLATMAAEAIAQRRQQRAAEAASIDTQAAAALRAQQTAARTAARLQWQPVLDPRRVGSLSLADTGLAWAAAQAWRPTDPEAELASTRAQDRLRELRPDVMSRFDRLTADGLEPVEAMRRVAPFLDRPPAREHPSTTRSALPAADPSLLAAAAGVAARAADDQLGAHGRAAGVLDDPATELVDERHEALGGAAAHRQQANTLHGDAAQLRAAATSTSLEPSVRTPPEVARDGYPEPLTGQVLAGGKVKAKTPDRTAPAAVRSTALATAARAASGRAR
jgi:hypothetical protein